MEQNMTDTVQIKRLPNCFIPSERTVKLHAALAFIAEFPTEKKQRLRQFDEIEKCPYTGIIAQIHNNSVSDTDLDQFIVDAGIEMYGETIYKDHMVIDLPKRASEGAAGYDLQAAIDDTVYIMPGETALIPTGLSISMPNDLELQVRPRSGLAIKHGITVLNTPGTVDSDYGGEIKVILINHGKNTFCVRRGDRIAQAVFNKISVPEFVEVESLNKTTRGSGGFGSTGV